jgi:hypothetical protein
MSGWMRIRLRLHSQARLQESATTSDRAKAANPCHSRLRKRLELLVEGDAVLPFFASYHFARFDDAEGGIANTLDITASL